MSQGSATPPRDNASFADLVNEHWTVVYRCLMHLAGNEHDAEELTQEAFLRALNHWPMAQPELHPRAWLMRIARNAYLDLARRRATVKFEPLAVERAVGEGGPMGLELSEEAAKVRAALAELSELTRSVFLMRVEGELAFAEIAAALATSEEACRWHMHQARSKLAKILTAGE